VVTEIICIRTFRKKIRFHGLLSNDDAIRQPPERPAKSVHLGEFTGFANPKFRF
jgi:hypothetical protein